MPCPDSLRTQAYFDGEVDALAAADIERHLDGCAKCRALIDDYAGIRDGIRGQAAPLPTPPALRARILRTLAAEEDAGAFALPAGRGGSAWRTRPFWLGALGGIGGSALAAACALLLIAPRADNPLLDELVADHVRSLMPPHLIDVVSTDRHTVKPWFAGHADVSPVVADFADQGYRLVGGRTDYVDHQRSAVVVYQHGPHVVNVFSWARRDRDAPDDTTRNGYHIACWNRGNLEYCAVSDTGWSELRDIVRLLQAADAD